MSREDIRRLIWPENTFVDFDSSLRVAVGKLRDALGDEAEHPVYVETIPKRGYRFLAPLAVPGPAPLAADEAAASLPRGARLLPWVATAAVLVACAGAIVGYRWTRSPRPILSDKDTVVLADFTNTTGDPVFDATLRQGLVVQLDQSPFLSLVSDERMQQVLKMMAQPPNTPLTPEVARAICERTGSAAVIDGSIARLGSEYVLGLRATSCRTGEPLGEEQVQAARKEDVLNALSQAARAFRSRLGESLATVQKFDTPLADATTPSLDALRAYSAGLRAISTGGSGAAIPLLKQAVDIDPGFAMAHAWLGRTYGDVGEFSRSAESTSKAYELRARASQSEQYFIAASYDLQVSGNLEKARQTCESWAQEYPRVWIPHAFLAGIIAPALGAFDRAVEQAHEAVADNPGFTIGYALLAYGHQYQNRFADAERALDLAGPRKGDIPEFLIEAYDLAFLKNDGAAMARVAAEAHGNPEAEYWVDDHRAFVLAYAGRLKDAATTARRAAAMALQSGEQERAAQFQAGEAVWDAFYGDAAGASRAAAGALARSSARDVEYGAAFALALVGERARAQALADDLERRLPEDTDVRFNYLPAIRALLALDAGAPEKALDALRMSGPYELAPTRSSMHAFYGALYPVYVRGLSYLAAHRGTDAAAEFQKIVDRPGLVVSDPVGALARYQLARAHAMAGNTARARSAHEAVLGLWKDADPGVPVVKQARASY